MVVPFCLGGNVRGLFGVGYSYPDDFTVVGKAVVDGVVTDDGRFVGNVSGLSGTS